MTYSKTKYFLITVDYILPFMLFICSLTVLYLLFLSSVFRIRNINCFSDFEPCTNPFVLAEIEHLKGQNIFLFHDTAFLSRLTSANFQIRSGTIKKNLPNTLTVDLVSVYPVIALQIPDDSRFVTLDQHLQVIKLTEHDPHVPVVIYPRALSLQVGQPPSDVELKQNLEFILSLIHNLPGIGQIRIMDADINVVLDNKVNAVFTTHRSALDQLAALKAVLGDATIMEGVRKVDVRFAQPILIRD